MTERRPSMALFFSEDPHDAALAVTRLAGCTCDDPDIEVRGNEITIKHDLWCAVLRKGGK